MTWKETGFFDIASEVAPAMNSAQALKVALELTKAQPIAKKLVREGDVQYLVKLKEAKFEASDLKAQDKELIEREKSTEAFKSWVEDFKKTASIETNNALIKQKAQE
jgi:peptidyl-prolyl cis-trans isomerase D